MAKVITYAQALRKEKAKIKKDPKYKTTLKFIKSEYPDLDKANARKLKEACDQYRAELMIEAAGGDPESSESDVLDRIKGREIVDGDIIGMHNGAYHIFVNVIVCPEDIRRDVAIMSVQSRGGVVRACVAHQSRNDIVVWLMVAEHDDDGFFLIIRKVFPTRFFDVVGTCTQAVFAGVVTKFQYVTLYHRQQNLFLPMPFFYKIVCLHFIA